MQADAERYRWLTAVDEGDFNTLADLAHVTVGDAWRPIPVEWIDDELNSGKPKSDYPTLGSTPVLSQHAVDELMDVLVENGEILPLNGDPADRYYAYNVTRILDALDTEKSDAIWFGPGRIMMMKQYAFRDTKLAGATIFKVPQLRVQVFVTEPVVNRIQSSGLTGFSFREVWKSGSAGA
jgi:hypothetical protein